MNLLINNVMSTIGLTLTITRSRFASQEKRNEFFGNYQDFLRCAHPSIFCEGQKKKKKFRGEQMHGGTPCWQIANTTKDSHDAMR